MRHLFVAFPLALCACSVFNVTDQVKNFHPYAMNIDGTVPLTDKAQADYSADESPNCNNAALAYSHPFDLTSIGIAGVSGALQEAGASAASANPVVLAAGAGGQGGNEALNGAGLDTPERKFIKALCMRDLGLKHATYDIIDPILRGMQ